MPLILTWKFFRLLDTNLLKQIWKKYVINVRWKRLNFCKNFYTNFMCEIFQITENSTFINYDYWIISLTVNSSMYLAVNMRGHVGPARLTCLSIINRTNRLRIALLHTRYYYLQKERRCLMLNAHRESERWRRIITSLDVISDSSLILSLSSFVEFAQILTMQILRKRPSLRKAFFLRRFSFSSMLCNILQFFLNS